jgi:hypothetical protein
MAKKIIVDEIKRASAALKDFHIEHLIVAYVKPDGSRSASIVVLNKLFEDAKTAIQTADVKILKTRGARHYEKLATSESSRISIQWKPEFECKCRHCGKTFKSPIKEQVWCSRKCKDAYRKELKTKSA